MVLQGTQALLQLLDRPSQLLREPRLVLLNCTQSVLDLLDCLRGYKWWRVLDKAERSKALFKAVETILEVPNQPQGGLGCSHPLRQLFKDMPLISEHLLNALVEEGLIFIALLHEPAEIPDLRGLLSELRLNNTPEFDD